MPVHDSDLALIANSLDFYGVNYYNPTTVGAAPEGSSIPFELLPMPDAKHTGFGWPIDPASLRDFLLDLSHRHPEMPPIVIGENGASFPEPNVAQRVQDDDRIDFLGSHISAVADAIDAGVRVDEFTVWSLMDNFEWADGYTQRFGLVHVDFESGERTPKASYDWYRDLIAASRNLAS